ncbi:transcriptional regulator [Helicobacter aurati]|uniref:Transcriptional regulator n=1 Tax=Helicobacter aurati TaxID=137778 RepID=A0A3D8IX23_9HELI|nr:transcriptional regulator [Helicobacter aurati]RDU69829.1 transcriptional regulator [Helicobacter aurati]
MATSENFKDFVLEMLYNALQGEQYRFSAKKMFGEYCIYVLDSSSPVPKPIFLLCDEILYVKQHEILKPILESATKGFPYSGAKEYYILDVDSPSLLKEVVLVLAPTLPIPKPKKAKK